MRIIKKKVFLLFIIIINIIFVTSQSKYIDYKEIEIVKINIDTLIPKIEMMNIQKTMYSENNEELFDIFINLNVIESNIKEKNINEVEIIIDDIEINDFEIKENEEDINNIIYEFKIKKLHKNQQLKMIIPEGIIIDNANNRNEEKIVEYEIS